jgi:hypothetical protein
MALVIPDSCDRRLIQATVERQRQGSVTMKTLLVTVLVIVSVGFGALAQEPGAPAAVFTVSQAAAGQTAYQSVCFNCHQDNLAGRRGDPGELPPLDSLPPGMQKDIQRARGKVPDLAGPEFRARWANRSTADLAARIKGATPFLEKATPFLLEDADPDAYLNLAAYILQVNGAPAGTDAFTEMTDVPMHMVVAVQSK